MFKDGMWINEKQSATDEWIKEIRNTHRSKFKFLQDEDEAKP